jgi:hypothetical protein
MRCCISAAAVVLLMLVPMLRAQEQPVPAPPPAAEPDQAYFGQHIQRSMALLATSSKQRQWPVKVLIYGQSITGSTVLTRMIEAFLRQRYPFAALTLENRSIGGFGADRLVRTMEHDVLPFYPDLLIFHVYGGELTGDLEGIISNVRRYTTADIVIFNHHQNGDGKAELELGPKTIRYLAQKYDCELVDVTAQWPRYLEENHFVPSRMLRDNVHPNPDGLALLTTLIGRHLQFNPLSPSGSGMNTVRWYAAKRPLDEGVADEIVFTGPAWKLDDRGAIGDSPGSGLRLQFEGNRVDAIEAHVKGGVAPGTAKILIDGKPPSQNPRLYALTLPSKGPETWFPCIRRVRSEALPLLEDWTLRITEINADASRIRFQVTGSKTGPDGDGVSWERFVSKSRRVVIESRDWMLADIMKIFKQTAPPAVGYEVKWSVLAQSADTYKPEKTGDAGKVYAITLAQGLTNAVHTIEIVPNGDGPVPIEALQVYRPPLK